MCDEPRFLILAIKHPFLSVMSFLRPLSKAEKSFFVVCLLAVVPMGAVADAGEDRDAEPAWNIPPAAPRPKPNGYDFYVAAAKSTVRFSPEVDPASDIRRPDSENAFDSPYALKNYSLARRKAWLSANARTFALVSQGLHTPSMAPDSGLGMGRYWGRLRQLERDISVRMRTFQMEGKPFLATQSALDGMQMGQDVSRGGALSERLVCVAIMANNRSPLDDFDKTINQLSADEARTCAQRLEVLLEKEPTSAQTLQEERRVDLTQLRQMLSRPNWREPLQFNAMPGETLWQTLRRRTVSKREIYENMTRREDTAIVNSTLPYSQAMVANVPQHLDPFTNLFPISPKHIRKSEARAATSNNMLLLRLALRSYIAEHGQAPKALSALVPSVLKKPIPTDVYNDGRPLFYQPHGATYRLWSVGPDMKNDGGIPFPPRNAGAAKVPVSNLMDNKGDFVAGLCR